MSWDGDAQTVLAPCHDPRYKFYIAPDSPSDLIVLREIWCENVYEVQGADISADGTVVDLGANIGVFTVFAATRGADVRVFAFEPEPHNFNLLESNVWLNGVFNRVHRRKVAVGGEAGVAVISNEYGDSTIMDGKPGTEVEVVTLDSLWETHELGEVDVLKVDVEGAEADLLLAASRPVLQACRFITAELDVRCAARLGEIVNKLSETHQVKTVGSHEVGGMVYARRY